MRAGQLRRRIKLRTMARIPDGGGGYTETPVDGATIWARIEPLDGDEQIQAMQTGMVRPHRITIRHREDVTGVTTVIYEDRTFDVKSIVDLDERRRELVLLADEVRP